MGEKAFQQMCSALLASDFPGVTCMPVGQSDGGRDAVRRNESGGSVIYQVKWTAKPVQNAVNWLRGALDGEADNIRRLVREGATEYVLITSVAGTSVPGRGTMDRLEELLRIRSAELGISMACWWRADIDARLDRAPHSLLWSYADMLAGWQLISYLLAASRGQEREERLWEVMKNVVATQWDEDSKVKFKQVDLDSYDLDDLYIDVEAERVVSPRRAGQLDLHFVELGKLGGVAKYLLGTDVPLTLVRGAPGQGKSTLTQYLCQLHRAAFLDSAVNTLASETDTAKRKLPRVPLRVDLRDYASWLLGHDPFDVAHFAAKPRKSRKTGRSVESFLARLLEAKSGDMTVRVDDVHDLIARFPLLLVLDGLDEVASIDVRQEVVNRIDDLVARLARYEWAPQVVVTTRPNSSGLAEPSPDRFETIVLQPLGVDLRRAYLGKWADSRQLASQDRVVLERIFEERSAEPHISQLAENPMQLTILLYLIQKRGDSIPHSRTDLYRSYMQTFLDREAAKSSAVQKHRDDLEEVTAHLGWLFQALAESAGASGQLPVKEIKHAILTYLFNAEKNTNLVEDLFTAVTDRVWALTSKEQGTFRFDVQPVQEYFAAYYLFHFAGAEQPRFDAAEVFRALVRRPYWFNTCRFYAGFASVNELVALAEVLEEEVTSSSPPLDAVSPQSRTAHVRMVIWTLLADGIFSARPKTQRRVAKLISDDLGVRLVLDLLDHRHDLPEMAADRGGAELVEVLQEAISMDPSRVVNRQRAELVAHILRVSEPAAAEAWRTWWLARLSAVENSDDQAAWLTLGAPLECGILVPEQTATRLALAEPDVARAALEADLSVPAGTAEAQWLLRAVLDGHCSDVSPGVPSSEAAGLILLWAPHHFRAKAFAEMGRAHEGRYGDHQKTLLGNEYRRDLSKWMMSLDARYERVHEAMKTQRGQKGTTSSWSNTARALAAIHGPSFLAAEITVIGAALPVDKMRTEGDFTRDSLPFGENADYGRLLRDIRMKRRDSAWWKSSFKRFPDHLSRATWVLCLLAVADSQVVGGCLDLIDEATSALPRSDLQALRLASSRSGVSGLGRRIDRNILQDLGRHSVDTALLVLHHVLRTEELTALDGLSDDFLSNMIDLEPCSWPAVRAMHARMLESPSLARCDVLRAAGPVRHLAEKFTPKLPDELLNDILGEPADVPTHWLRVAEAQHSEKVRLNDLAAHAKGERWFA
ncbi:hypothetical protein AB0A63_00215 [Lentzea sp. NPDC042327]|uniref:NACHT domain-containing protein n=1 Tax=Lentzea sp. NPDC042327 TaxID=3154801 RepID=UPI0033FDE21D